MGFGTTIFYGNLQLLNCKIKRFDQTVQFDESGSDAMFSRFTITVESHVHDQDTLVGMFDLSLFGASPAFRLKALQSYLQHPRRRFRMFFEDDLWLDVEANATVGQGDVVSAPPTNEPVVSGRVDVDNGPKVHSCNVTHVAGFKTFRVDITFEVCVVLCVGENNNLQSAEFGVLIHNRWSLEESLDDSMHWHRTITGKARIGHPVYWRQSMRYLVVPHLSPYMKFAGSQYVQTKDAMYLDYRYSMRQMHAAPIPPSIDWSCTHAEETGIGGGQGTSSIVINMTGDPQDHNPNHKRRLFVAALMILEARIGYQLAKEGAEPTASFWITSARLVDRVHTPDIELAVQLQRSYAQELPDVPGNAPPADRWSGLTWQMLGAWPMTPGPITGYRRDIWPEPSPTMASDPGPAAMFNRLWQSPCGHRPSANEASIYYHQHEADHQRDNNLAVNQPPPDESVESGTVFQSDFPLEDTPAASPLKVDPEQAKSLWMDIELRPRYIVDHGRVFLPYFATEQYFANNTNTNGTAVRLHRPVSKLCIWYRATRMGKVPDIPKIVDQFTDVNGIVYWLDEEETLDSPPALVPDATNYMFSVELRLVYLMSRQLRTGDHQQVGALPWDTSKADENRIIYGARENKDIF